MRIRIIKGLRPQFIKQMAVLIGICYLMNLLQYQIRPVLHAISHALEVTGGIIAHNSTAPGEYAEHGHVYHSTFQNQHEHGIIDLFDSIFDASGHEQNSEESMIILIKVDKHIAAGEYFKKKLFEFQMPTIYMPREQKSKKGHLKILPKPPQNVLG